MNARLRRFTAWVALFFMTVFTVTFIVHLSNPSLLEGKLAILAGFSFAFGLILFVVIRLNDAQKKLIDESINLDDGEQ